MVKGQMTTFSKNGAFAKLLEYERRGTRFAPGSEDGSGDSEEWSGVTFSLAGLRLACNIDRVSEILPCPQPTPVPGAKDWIVGLANVRGELLTVIDLASYLTGTRTAVRSSSRLLATTLNKAPIGLLIDEVFGQRHFRDRDAVPAELDEGSALSSVVSRQHQLGAETWNELDLDKLFHSADFLHGAAQ
jgi:twitching motility protein PilI